MPEDFWFWYDWILATAALKGDITLSPAILERWENEKFGFVWVVSPERLDMPEVDFWL